MEYMVKVCQNNGICFYYYLTLFTGKWNVGTQNYWFETIISTKKTCNSFQLHRDEVFKKLCQQLANWLCNVCLITFPINSKGFSDFMH